METALQLLPPRLKAMINRDALEEIRLRAGKQAGIVSRGEEKSLDYIITNDELARVLEVATQGSFHTALDSIRHGFITIAGGHRLGIGGTAVMQDGEVKLIRDISSINIRIAREYIGVSRPIADKLFSEGHLRNTLITSFPGGGKTTLLRDLILQISDGGEGRKPLKVSVADERGELAACYGGQPRLNVGAHTDVLEGCPKRIAVGMMLRALGPQVIAMDEITDDTSPVRAVLDCGVSILATAHGFSRTEYKGLFERFVTIEIKNGRREYAVRDENGVAV